MNFKIVGFYCKYPKSSEGFLITDDFCLHLYLERASALDSEDAALRFGHRNVVFCLFLVTNIKGTACKYSVEIFKSQNLLFSELLVRNSQILSPHLPPDDTKQRLIVEVTFMHKVCIVCTISFERPVDYLCDAWHVFPPKYEAWTHFNN